MAVTLTAATLAKALDPKVGYDVEASPSGTYLDLAARLLQSGTALVEQFSPNAPTAIKNEAVMLWATWTSARQTAAAIRPFEDDVSAPTVAVSSFRSSGARSLLRPWREIQMGIAE